MTSPTCSVCQQPEMVLVPRSTIDAALDCLREYSGEHNNSLGAYQACDEVFNLLAALEPAAAEPQAVTEAMLDAACAALSRAEAYYPDGQVHAPVSDWFDLDPQDAVDFGVLRKPKWHFYSDIRGDQHEDYIARVLREPMRAALTAALRQGGKE